jgi:aryl-phospho-beta-D-glucosidase BglC (GH1 family)
VTEEDLNRLQQFGITHVRVPVGWWLVDYVPTEGFVDGGEKYLRRLLKWLQVRGMRCVIDLHALPGAQTSDQSFTGKQSKIGGFFLDRSNYIRGQKVIEKLAQLIVSYERDPTTAGVVLGLELVNEPQWKFWHTSPGIRELYEMMVPVLRRQLPAYRYAIFLNFMESPRTVGSKWLADMRKRDPGNYESVIYDVHMYHSYGDDNGPGREWTPYVDSCKTCCRDPVVLEPLVEHDVPIVIGEYSLNTGFPGNPEFYLEYLKNQLSLWQSTPGMVGSFFWNHRILRNPGGWYKEMSLLELLLPTGPLPPISQMNLTVRCPGKDLSKCPKFEPNTTNWSDECVWRGNPDVNDNTGKTQARLRDDGSRTNKGGSSR